MIGGQHATRTKRRETTGRCGGAAVMVAKIATGEIEEELPENREDKVNGGKARANGMTPEERSGLARKAAQAGGTRPE